MFRIYPTSNVWTAIFKNAEFSKNSLKVALFRLSKFFFWTINIICCCCCCSYHYYYYYYYYYNYYYYYYTTTTTTTIQYYRWYRSKWCPTPSILTIGLLFSLKFSIPEKSRGTNGLFWKFFLLYHLVCLDATPDDLQTRLLHQILLFLQHNSLAV